MINKTCFSVFLMCSAVVFSAAIAQASEAPRWSDLRSLEEKFRSLPEKDDGKKQELVAQAADMMLKLVPNQKQKLDGIQVREFVGLLQVVHKADLGNLILDENYQLLMSNKKEILAEVKKLSPKDSAEIADMIDTVIEGMKSSDQPSSKVKKGHSKE